MTILTNNQNTKKTAVNRAVINVPITLENTLCLQQQAALRKILEKGLPTVVHPYQVIADDINSTESLVIEQIKKWQESGLIKRFGLVVKHRRLGFNANAMVVWNIPDELIPQVASQLSNFNEVSLCYRRPRRLPEWPYNLFCMIHGTDRDIVLAQIEEITKQLLALNPSMVKIEKDILFSTKAYKQQGARYGNNKRSVNNILNEKSFIKNKDVSHG